MLAITRPSQRRESQEKGCREDREVSGAFNSFSCSWISARMVVCTWTREGQIQTELLGQVVSLVIYMAPLTCVVQRGLSGSQTTHVQPAGVR